MHFVIDKVFSVCQWVYLICSLCGALLLDWRYSGQQTKAANEDSQRNALHEDPFKVAKVISRSDALPLNAPEQALSSVGRYTRRALAIDRL